MLKTKISLIVAKRYVVSCSKSGKYPSISKHSPGRSRITRLSSSSSSTKPIYLSISAIVEPKLIIPINHTTSLQMKVHFSIDCNSSEYYKINNSIIVTTVWFYSNWMRNNCELSSVLCNSLVRHSEETPGLLLATTFPSPGSSLKFLPEKVTQ